MPHEIIHSETEVPVLVANKLLADEIHKSKRFVLAIPTNKEDLSHPYGPYLLRQYDSKWCFISLRDASSTYSAAKTSILLVLKEALQSKHIPVRLLAFDNMPELLEFAAQSMREE